MCSLAFCRQILRARAFDKASRVSLCCVLHGPVGLTVLSDFAAWTVPQLSCLNVHYWASIILVNRRDPVSLRFEVLDGRLLKSLRAPASDRCLSPVLVPAICFLGWGPQHVKESLGQRWSHCFFACATFLYIGRCSIGSRAFVKKLNWL